MMKTLNTWFSMVAIGGLLLMFSSSAPAQEKRFLDLVGPGPVGPTPSADNIQVPYITWGGDMATFYANGGLTTKPGSLFQKQGLNLRLTPGVVPDAHFVNQP